MLVGGLIFYVGKKKWGNPKTMKVRREAMKVGNLFLQASKGYSLRQNGLLLFILFLSLSSKLRNEVTRMFLTIKAMGKGIVRF